MEDLLGKRLRKINVSNIRPLHRLALNSFALPADSHSWGGFFPFCGSIVGPHSGHRRDVRCLRNHCGEAGAGNGIRVLWGWGGKHLFWLLPPSYMCSPHLCVLLYILLSGFLCATCFSLRALGQVFNVVHRWCSQKSRYLLMGFCAKHFHCSFQQPACLCKYVQTLILLKHPLPCSWEHGFIFYLSVFNPQGGWRTSFCGRQPLQDPGSDEVCTFTLHSEGGLVPAGSARCHNPARWLGQICWGTQLSCPCYLAGGPVLVFCTDVWLR